MRIRDWFKAKPEPEPTFCVNCVFFEKHDCTAIDNVDNITGVITHNSCTTMRSSWQADRPVCAWYVPNLEETT